MLRGVYNAGLHFLAFFKSQESELNILITFFPAEHEYQIYFSLSRQHFLKLNVKSLNRIINIGVFRKQLRYV